MKCLFWNTYRNKMINDVLCELIYENNASMVALAEYTANIYELTTMLAVKGIVMRKYDSCCPRITMLGNIDKVELKADSEHSTIQILDDKDILCCVHLNSKLYGDHESYRELLIDGIVHDIQVIEEELGTENSIIVGDFNINPYEPCCVDARFFHGVPVLSEADRKTRTIAGKKYFMFYNPMWNFLGDYKQPYGTYYCNTGGTQNIYWNIFDQVIFRPALKERFVKESLKILTETETRYLLDNNGHPDRSISDHLPIIFEIMEEKIYG